VVGAILGMLIVGLVVATPYQIWIKRRRSADGREPGGVHEARQ
jgi:hypothetical protein